MVCGADLIYAQEAKAVSCQYCGQAGTSLICCPDGHYVCDSCHGAGSLAVLEKLAGRVRGAAPEQILEELLQLPALPMHGPEHHPMVALALLLAVAKAGRHIPDNAVAEALRRGMQVPGGACGYLGGCGAGISLGVAVSLLTGATPLKGKERALANRASALGLIAAGDGEARCCKRALRNAVREGRRFLGEELGIDLPAATGRAICRDVARNRECAMTRCSYFPPGEGPL
ncbi:hypothetical protein DESUT3_25790 [Desulfuromonas versatilis]|uniref:DUF5714 domain-containing protein n=2 Tax=Desulfuromonas versatilis TaxID=2802975 RepID=A0ABM8HWL8_9BACT|nr:hypothetical protein DESUT3_25790 [Desulfuromonas versatilis]